MTPPGRFTSEVLQFDPELSGGVVHPMWPGSVTGEGMSGIPAEAPGTDLG